MLSAYRVPNSSARHASCREFLKIGDLGLGGLSRPGLLRAEQESGISRFHKAVIMICKVGAPPHQDMYDLMTDAPAEIRGEFKPVHTEVPGVQLCDHLPKLASIADKLSPLRSVYGPPSGDHDSFICYTGRAVPKQSPGEWPSIGSAVANVLGSSDGSVPPFFGLAPGAGHPPYGSTGQPGFLGVAHGAFRPSGPIRQNVTPNSINAVHFSERLNLLTEFDRVRSDLGASGTFDGVDAFRNQALEILTSNKMLEALDLSKEPLVVRERSGKGDPKNYGDRAPRSLEHFLMARHLVETGARVVTLNFGRWDFHSNNISECKSTHFPWFDHGMHTLISDLHDRGLDKDVAVVAGASSAARRRSTRTLVAPLAAAGRRVTRGWRVPQRAGDRVHRSPRRGGHLVLRSLRRSSRHALPPRRDRPARGNAPGLRRPPLQPRR